MNEYSKKLALLAEKLEQADAVLVGAGAGLTASAGLDYSGQAFREQFADYIDKYHFTDLYSSGFYPFQTDAEKWAYWARHVNFTRFAPSVLPAYAALKKLLEGKNYFIVTTNVDGQFFKAGFDRAKIMAFQGDYAEMQCARACHSAVYDNEHVVREILAHSQNLNVDEKYVPRCPICHGPMEMHLRKDEFFVEDSAWDESHERYVDFLRRNSQGQLLLFEFGVGFNTPGIIRYPFEELALHNPQAFLVRVNMHDSNVPKALLSRSLFFTEDAAGLIQNLLAKIQSNLGERR